MDIFEASRTNNISALESALASGPADITDARGSTPLIIAIYYNHLAAAELLLQAGADPERRDGMGNTALMGASFKGYTEAVKLLISKGAKVDALNGNRAGALTFAATFGHYEIIKLLLENGADPLIRDNTGKTAVDHTMIQENEQCYEILAAAANERIRQAVTVK